MGTKVSAPAPRNYGQETRDTLQAQVDMAPKLYASESEWQPKYTALELKNLQMSLLGDGTQRGLLDIYEKDVNPAMSRMEAEALRAQREADIGAVEQYGGRATTALRQMSGNAPLLNEFNRQAMEDLQAGQSLTAGELRGAQQASRAAFSARGMGMGMQSAADEVLQQYRLGNERQAQRRQFAGNVVGLNQQTGGDPFMAILGRPGQAFAAGQGMAGQGMGISQGSGPSLFNPESSYAGNIFNQNYQGELSARTATAANKAAMIGAGIGAVGAIGGAFAGGYGKALGTAAGCWVAREVYGEDNPSWLLFRQWLETEAPDWFHSAYVRFGERFAKMIRPLPRVKAIIRRWMDSKIKTLEN